MNRKEQAGLEFLMTYGWAILVVLVTIAVLAYFGVLSPTKSKVCKNMPFKTTEEINTIAKTNCRGDLIYNLGGECSKDETQYIFLTNRKENGCNVFCAVNADKSITMYKECTKIIKLMECE